jgi:hypothetical protein
MDQDPKSGRRLGLAMMAAASLAAPVLIGTAARAGDQNGDAAATNQNVPANHPAHPANNNKFVLGNDAKPNNNRMIIGNDGKPNNNRMIIGNDGKPSNNRMIIGNDARKPDADAAKKNQVSPPPGTGQPK